ncbi:hypothetical protein BMW23_0338 [Bodo saltans virus]|uniref:Uncharacterized protein n=1 Tax=Bodo saltans virus TaxID=2024608 RepID=A0A2H4UU98_9VIRU|nr:hypothetical protein QJ851_gp0332 [Bodo saltans virus]ATZ80395.1 hypothetical protein BMW23_0338 [Bodo saltans virus]
MMIRSAIRPKSGKFSLFVRWNKLNSLFRSQYGKPIDGYGETHRYRYNIKIELIRNQASKSAMLGYEEGQTLGRR